ncbi:MAG: hypothetical protein HRT45_04840 [Bdellovibrionales bacterium]|nr:hypothetical protein [Bdellovibrionales bacterium]
MQLIWFMDWSARTISNILGLLIVLPLAVGCGEGFQAVTAKDSFDYTFKTLPSDLDGQVSLADYNDEIRSYNVDEAVTAGLGFGNQVTPLSGAPVVGGDNVETVMQSNLDFSESEMTADLLVNFGQLQPALKMGHHLARVTASKRCASLTGEMPEVDPAADYNCGEVPVGETLPNGRKRLMTLVIDRLEQKGDPEFEVPSSTVHLYLHRNQNAGQVTLDDLDTLKRTSVSTGTRLFDQGYFRLYPNAGDLNMQFCTLVPGLAISSDLVVLNGKGKKKLGPITARATAQVQVDLGLLSFDSAQLCSTFRLVNNVDGSVSFDFVDVQVPKLQNLALRGLRVNTKVDAKGFVGAIAKILKIFAVDIEGKIEKQINDMVRKEAKEFASNILKDHVSSGDYLKSYLIEAGLYSKVIPELESQVNDVLSRVGPGSTLQMGSWFSEACKELEFGDGMLTTTTPLWALCNSTATFKSLMFLGDPVSHANGCYSHFMPVGALSTHEGKWWSKNCKFRTRIEVTMPAALGPLYACLVHHMNYDGIGLTTSHSCPAEIELLEQAWQNFDQQDREYLGERLREVAESNPEVLGPYGIIMQDQLNELFD